MKRVERSRVEGRRCGSCWAKSFDDYEGVWSFLFPSLLQSSLAFPFATVLLGRNGKSGFENWSFITTLIE